MSMFSCSKFNLRWPLYTEHELMEPKLNNGICLKHAADLLALHKENVPEPWNWIGWHNKHFVLSLLALWIKMFNLDDVPISILKDTSSISTTECP